MGSLFCFSRLTDGRPDFRWGVESGFLVEKHQGCRYEHGLSYEWEAMRGHHYLIRLGHALNVLSRYSHALAKEVCYPQICRSSDLIWTASPT